MQKPSRTKSASATAASRVGFTALLPAGRAVLLGDSALAPVVHVAGSVRVCRHCCHCCAAGSRWPTRRDSRAGPGIADDGVQRATPPGYSQQLQVQRRVSDALLQLQLVRACRA